MFTVPTGVVENFELPTSANGVQFEWTSNGDLLKVSVAAGKVTVAVERPGLDTTLKLTVKASYGGKSLTKVFDVKILGVRPTVETIDEPLMAELQASLELPTRTSY